MPQQSEGSSSNQRFVSCGQGVNLSNVFRTLNDAICMSNVSKDVLTIWCLFLLGSSSRTSHQSADFIGNGIGNGPQIMHRAGEGHAGGYEPPYVVLRGYSYIMLLHNKRS
eukprot:622841-Prorocentrum_minimum.AAC.5